MVGQCKSLMDGNLGAGDGDGGDGGGDGMVGLWPNPLSLHWSCSSRVHTDLVT